MSDEAFEEAHQLSQEKAMSHFDDSNVGKNTNQKNEEREHLCLRIRQEQMTHKKTNEMNKVIFISLLELPLHG